MTTNENFEELKQSTKTVLQILTENNLYYALLLLVILVVLLKLVDLVFLPLRKRKSVLTGFLKGCIKVFLIITFGMRICSLIPFLKDFASQIVISSSLIVVVLGFVFQEGLTNIVHGLIISIFRPFQIGDRITATVDGEKITGYVTEITPRHTVIQNVMNSAHVIIPNAKMDMSAINNNYFEKHTLSTSFLDVQITYESDLDRAMAIIAGLIETHPLVEKALNDKKAGPKTKEPVSVMVRDLASDGICLRAVVTTLTVEENFVACSDLRRDLVIAFKQDPSIEIAYPHMQLVK